VTMAIETKREKFDRLSRKRVEAVKDAIRKVGNLSNRSFYEYQKSDIDSMFDDIIDSLEAAYNKFDSELTRSRRRLAMTQPQGRIRAFKKKLVSPGAGSREMTPSHEGPASYDSRFRRMGYEFGQKWAERATAAQVNGCLASRPQVPADLDRELLQDAANRCGRLLEEVEKRELRNGFWEGVDLVRGG
jgi:DNA invertase Pin-like site-specific DNA recombinase